MTRIFGIAVEVGYIDDLETIGVTLIQLAIYMDDDIKNKGKEKLIVCFGYCVDTSDIGGKQTIN